MGQVQVLLLRGVNVSGANKLPMQPFRAMLEGLGLTGVATHIQSGNAVFHDPGIDQLGQKISAALLARFGLKAPVFLIPIEEYRAALAANPFGDAGAADGRRVHIIFLAHPDESADLAALRAFAVEGEAVHLTARAAYLHTPAGFGTSVLAGKLHRFIKAPQTARNQRSAEAILALAEAVPCAS